jgi:hypothetical protein
MAGKKGQAPRVEFSQELFDAICEQMADGKSLCSICRATGMPNKRTVLRWVEKSPELQAQYSLAILARADHHFEEILEIADKVRLGSKKTIKADGGIEITKGDMIERARLQVDARKWVLARMNPKKYGERVTNEHTGGNGGPIEWLLSQVEGSTLKPKDSTE